MQHEIWIEGPGANGVYFVRWQSLRGNEVQRAESEAEARAFVAGLSQGLNEARRIISDAAPRFDARLRPIEVQP